jgi:glycosyltransferase involved in cell wall biosynthesis
MPELMDTLEALWPHGASRPAQRRDSAAAPAPRGAETAPLFSIIMVHYQGSVSRQAFARSVESIQAQTFKDFELICYHDGPLLDPAAPQPVKIRCTARRHNDWGHSLRDIGIREARGQYIVHLNADNVLYPHALQAIAAEIRRPAIVLTANGRQLDLDNIVIFPIVMHDHVRFMYNVMRLPPASGRSLILTGNPPIPGNIDCMQLVMKRSLWLAEGSWYDKSKESDSLMYQLLAPKYGYRTVGQVLGEHF